MKAKITILAVLMAQTFFGQEAGNVNYQKQHRLTDININVGLPSSNDMIISVKGLVNLKADTYVAVFNLVQVGKTTTEVNEMIDKRIEAIQNKIKGKPNVSMFVDILTFVPVYEFEVEKKTFSRKTYNEIPIVFEVKKNIHIEYKDPNFLNELISVCSENEIYDLVRVDYFSSGLENAKKELMNKAKLILKEKQKNYEELLGASFTDWDKQLADGYSVKYPTEMYQSYQVNSSSSLNLSKKANVNYSEKSTTLYYQPIMDKEFDFVINPKIVEPVIQVMYEVKFKLIRPANPAAQTVTKNEIKKEYLLVTPNGDIKNLPLN